MNIENLDAAICVFCMNIVAEKIDYSTTQFCADCQEYKGITTINDYILDYGYDDYIASTIARAETVLV
jgi:hypothetical protein